MKGFTDNYLRVEVPADESLVNRVAMVRLVEPTGEDDLIKGELA